MKYLHIRIYDMFAAISAEPQFRHRLDSFLPDQPEGDTISEIVRIRNEFEEEEKKKFKLPRWIRRLKFPHVIEPQSKCYLFNSEFLFGGSFPTKIYQKSNLHKRKRHLPPIVTSESVPSMNAVCESRKFVIVTTK